MPPRDRITLPSERCTPRRSLWMRARMSPRPNRLVPAPLLAAFITASSLGVAAETPYRFTALHGPEGAQAIGYGLNGHGAVAGTSELHHSGSAQATLWRRDMPLSLNQPGEESIAYGVNRYLAVVGISRQIGSDWRATLWQNGTVTLLPTLGGGYSDAFAINNAGQIVGDGEVAGYQHALRWDGGVPVDLGTLPGGLVSRARAINALGDVVGHSFTFSNVPHATLWAADGTVVDLGTLGGVASTAEAVNRHRWAAGYGENADFQTHAALWRAGIVIDLGTLGEGRTSYGLGIDHEGTVVGFSYTTPDDDVKYRRAALWRDGAAIDLNTWLDDATRAAGWVLLEARAIDDDGVVTGLARNTVTGKERAYRLSPPEAATGR
ncbi:MAG: hypothetical protein U1F53_08510 [Burkholderiaceae bacterium]